MSKKNTQAASGEQSLQTSQDLHTSQDSQNVEKTNEGAPSLSNLNEPSNEPEAIAKSANTSLPEIGSKKEGDTRIDLKASPKSAVTLIVKSKTEKFRRAGFEFTQTATVLSVSDLSDDEIQAIKQEPALIVVEGE